MNWSPRDYQNNASYVAKFGGDLLELLKPKTGEFILDIGCGDGVLTQKIADSGANVTGIDTSENMINACKKLGIESYVMSAVDFSFSKKFDAIFSNACLHWVKNHKQALQNFHKHLKPGGRFVAEFGGFGNIKTIQDAICQTISNAKSLNPWYFPTKEEYVNLLESSGFKPEIIELFERPTLLDTNIAGWLKTFASPYFAELSTAKVDEAIAKIVEICKPKLFKDGKWHADYVRLRISCHKI